MAATAEKIDLFKQHSDEYVARQTPAFVRAGKTHYLAVVGSGAPGGEEFQEKVGALYAVAYTIKMTRKFAGERDYVISKLEALWSGCEGKPKEEWSWRVMIRTPDFVKPGELRNARQALTDKGKGEGSEAVELWSLAEGQCVQMLHVGPYEKEGETIAVMKGFAESEGYELKGLHHDIYLSDPRRVPPERLKTILRHPVKKS